MFSELLGSCVPCQWIKIIKQSSKANLSRKELPSLFFDTGHIPSFCQSSLRINPEEVAEVFTVPLSVLCDPKNHGYTQVRTWVNNIYDLLHNNCSISLEYLAVLATLCQSFEGEPTQFGDSLQLLHYRWLPHFAWTKVQSYRFLQIKVQTHSPSFCEHSCLAQLINIGSRSRSRSSCDKKMFRNEPKFWIWERGDFQSVGCSILTFSEHPKMGTEVNN